MGSETKRWMIYGANGYTGRLCACEAQRRHMQPILAGRTGADIEPMARDFGFESRVFDLSDAAEAARHLEGVDTVLNCAGPFSRTARPMLDACSRSKTNYLDITGEIDVFEYVQGRNDTWKKAGIAVIPGVGFDVVPSDCLAAMLKHALPDARRLVLAFKAAAMKLSPGTAKTVAEGVADGCRVRRGGQITSIPLGSKTATIPFDSGPELAVAISWGDVSTAYYSTGIPDIEVYLASTPGQLRQLKTLQWFRWLVGAGSVQRLLQWLIDKRVKGPNEAERAASWAELYGEVTNAEGKRAAMVMRTPESYDLTYDAAVTAADKVVQGLVAPGAHTPSKAFGAEFVLGLRGVTCKRVE